MDGKEPLDEKSLCFGICGAIVAFRCHKRMIPLLWPCAAKREESKMKNIRIQIRDIRILVFIGLFISMDVILTRFLAFQTPIIRVSFGFLPIALSGIMFGPVVGGVTAMISDIIGMIIAPRGPYFPGFTVSAFLTGAIYGLFLHKKERSVIRVLLAVLVITVFVDSFLNTIWLMIMGLGNVGIILPRVFKNLIMVPVQTVMISLGWRYLGSFIEKVNMQKGRY